VSKAFPSFRFAAAVSMALLTLPACSSGNPDALTGMNVDENAAMMDANAAVEANLADANAEPADAASSNGTSEAKTGSATDAADNNTAAKPPERARTGREVNAASSNSRSSAELNDMQDNQVEAEPDIPNAVSNE
jgi:hypothetical protein